jgi:hypothetical protein
MLIGSVGMEAACKRGFRGIKFSYGLIKKIPDNNMDLLEEDSTTEYRILLGVVFGHVFSVVCHILQFLR